MTSAHELGADELHLLHADQDWVPSSYHLYGGRSVDGFLTELRNLRLSIRSGGTAGYFHRAAGSHPDGIHAPKKQL